MKNELLRHIKINLCHQPDYNCNGNTIILYICYMSCDLCVLYMFFLKKKKKNEIKTVLHNCVISN